MVRKVYIATTADEFLRLDAAGMDVVQLSFTKPLQADEFIFVGPGAKEAMMQFRAHGIAAEELGYMEGAEFRHFHWDMSRTAAEIRDIETPNYLSCGISGLGEHVRWRYPELGIIAGPYGSGKSLFAQLIAQDFVRSHGVPASLCCWEDQLGDIRDGLVRHLDTAMSAATARAKDAWLGNFHLAIADPTKDRFISDYIDLIEYQAKRYGCKFFVLDPWNEFDHQRNDKQSETEYVREVMKKLRKIVDLYKIIVYVVTHIPGDLYSNDGALKPFRIANSFGSSNFGAKADRGFCIVQATKWAGGEGSHMIIRQDKVKQADVWVQDDKGRWEIKEKKMGRKKTFAMKYSWKTNSIYYDEAATLSKDLQEIWKG